MDLRYKSTRSQLSGVTASQAILQGLAPDGGLFVPESLPALPKTPTELAELSYQDLAYEIMSLYLTDFTEEELRHCIDRAYDQKFDDPAIAPVTVKDGVCYLELFHGPTIAFKDMALSILPHLLTTAARKNQAEEEIVILTATSGDTGKAAMAGFCDVPGTRIIVFYPKDGVSAIQERQMVTQKGANTHVVAIHGNFDDAQNRVKEMFHDPELNKELKENGYRFSSANSINIGRLVPQIVYYVYAYGQILKSGAIAEGEQINITVPTGNFGNILAAYYASQMGLPVRKLICASNENKVLFDFFQSGTYDRNREFILTTSPSMDILISSNLERLIFRICGDDPKETAELMEALRSQGRYSIPEGGKKIMDLFIGGFATEEENFAGIKALFEKSGYAIDPHTGIANAVLCAYREKTKDEAFTVIASTASPYKFAPSVVSAIDPSYQAEDEFATIGRLHELCGVPVPRAVTELKDAPVLHTTVVDADDMKDTVRSILGMRR